VRNNIAALDAASGAVTDWNPNANAWVKALAVSGSTIYVGGSFTGIGGQARNRIAALDAATGEATAWNPDASALQLPSVSALAVSGSTVYAGGNFTSIGGQARNCIAELDAATGAATDWNPNAESEVLALAVSGSTVYAGGWFGGIGGLPQTGIAAITTPATSVPDVTGSRPLTLRLEISPNPVRGATQVAFGLLAAERVTLDVFDVAGRRVAELMRDQPETAGWHAMEFRPWALPGGVYFVRLQAGAETLSRKVLLLK
jgi:hypothetical protein